MIPELKPEDRKYTVTKITKKLIADMPSKVVLRKPGEVFGFITYARMDYREGTHSYYSYNFIPSKVYVTAPEKEMMAALIEIRKLNPEINFTFGQRGYLNEDFVNDNITQELIVTPND